MNRFTRCLFAAALLVVTGFTGAANAQCHSNSYGGSYSKHCNTPGYYPPVRVVILVPTKPTTPVPAIKPTTPGPVAPVAPVAPVTPAPNVKPQPTPVDPNPPQVQPNPTPINNGPVDPQVTDQPPSVVIPAPAPAPAPKPAQTTPLKG